MGCVPAYVLILVMVGAPSPVQIPMETGMRCMAERDLMLRQENVISAICIQSGSA